MISQNGALFVIYRGISATQQWCVDGWDTAEPYQLNTDLTLKKDQDQS